MGDHLSSPPAAPVGWKIMIHREIRSFSLEHSMWQRHIPAYAAGEKMVPRLLSPGGACGRVFLSRKFLQGGCPYACV